MRHGTVIQMAVQQLSCTGCGAEANASCNCGKPYLPKTALAVKAVTANPERSDRSIGADIGVDHKTVAKARRLIGDNSPVREGMDGKVRRLPVRPSHDEDDPEADVTPPNYRGAFLIRADQARQFAVYSGPITSEIVAMSRQVAAAWESLASKLERELYET